MDENHLSLVDYSLQLGERFLETRTQKERKESGQVFTPAAVARFMARQLGPIQDGDRILDPGIGSAALICAVLDRVISESQPLELWVEGYETDRKLCQVAREVLRRATELAASQGITIHARVHECDFVLEAASLLQSKLPLVEDSDESDRAASFTHVIANPPYFKLRKDDPRVRAVTGKVKGHTNIYTLFIALSVKRLFPGGRACFVTPRSFCSGAYFSAFRRELISEVVPLYVHLFDSREKVFQTDSVLQESIIFTFRKRHQDRKPSGQSAYLNISASHDATSLDKPVASRRVDLGHFLGERLGAFFFRIPTSELDERILDTVDSWPGSLFKYGLGISTGPVVAFRAEKHLSDAESVECGQAVPLLWMHNVNPYQVQWPARNGNKPQGISLSGRDDGLLLPRANYVLLRRFSAKEEPRRLISAPLLSEQYSHEWVGLENHLNYIHRRNSSLEPEEALGLTAFLNSALVDRYFRIVNGNTQVNAAELRALPLPPWDAIRQIGSRVERYLSESVADVNSVVFTTLRELGHLDEEFPIIEESRVNMGKMQEAQEILESLGMPQAQRNEISALTLLVLAQLSEETLWSAAQTRCMRIHDMLGAIKEWYGREYAENTRETIRRQVLHQFVQASIAVPNPDEPNRPTNSPSFCYALTDLALRTVKTYSSDRWRDAVQSFQDNQSMLVEIYRKKREQLKVSLCLDSGETYLLSPGKHNELQVAIVEEFGARFIPGGTLVYLGDTANKVVVLEEAVFEELGIPAPSHEKLPDVVIYDRERNWLFLVEAVTSHGPVSPKRHMELEEMLQGCSAGRVYVTAFPDFSLFRDNLTSIAWETEVWMTLLKK